MVEPQTRPDAPRKQRIDKEASVSPWLDTFHLAWGGIFVAAVLTILVISTVLGHILIGIVIIVGVAVLFAIEVFFPLFEDYKTTGLAWRHRKLMHRYASFRGKNRGFSNNPTLGEAIGAEVLEDQETPPLIPALGMVQFKRVELPNGSVLGVAWDHIYNTYSATMACSFSSLSSDDAYTRSERLEAFARLLNGFAETSNLVERFSWRWQTLMGERQKPEEAVEIVREGAKLSREDCPNREVYLKRYAEMGEKAVIDRVTMTLAISADNPMVKRLARTMGSIEAVLVQQLGQFHALAMGSETGRSPIGLTSAVFLSYNDLVLENLLALNPVRAQSLWQRTDWAGPRNERDFLGQKMAWPDFYDFEHESYCQLGQTYHQTFVLWEFTRSGVVPEQLWAILKAPFPKVVAVVFHMIHAGAALTRSEWSANTADLATRSKDRASATDVRMRDITAERETEIANSQGEDGQVACYITVTGATLDECDINVRRLHDAAGEARFVIMPLTNRQEQGIGPIGPYARGLAVPPLRRLIPFL